MDAICPAAVFLSHKFSIYKQSDHYSKHFSLTDFIY